MIRASLARIWVHPSVVLTATIIELAVIGAAKVTIFLFALATLVVIGGHL